MKKLFLLPMLLVSAFGQNCQDQYVCTPMGGCRWVTTCKQSPAPQKPLNCQDKYICTGMGGCRWVTICK
jgi:hypothetical protein